MGYFPTSDSMPTLKHFRMDHQLFNSTFGFFGSYFREPTTACAVAYHCARIRRLVRLARHR